MLQITCSPKADAISEVEAEFSHWRQTRTSLLTPESLKQQALSLLPHYSISDVCKRLRENHQTLKRWRRQHQPQATSQAFIELPLSSRQQQPPPSTADYPICITLSRKMSDGSAISVQGELSQPQWQWALQLLQQQDRSA